jgi:hypothetical protein
VPLTDPGVARSFDCNYGCGILELRKLPGTSFPGP